MKTSGGQFWPIWENLGGQGWEEGGQITQIGLARVHVIQVDKIIDAYQQHMFVFCVLCILVGCSGMGCSVVLTLIGLLWVCLLIVSVTFENVWTRVQQLHLHKHS